MLASRRTVCQKPGTLQASLRQQVSPQPFFFFFAWY
jgi:hypothetical protein